MQNLVDGGQRKGGLRGECIFGDLWILSFFVFLPSPPGHTRRPITTIYNSKRVFPRTVVPFRGLNDKRVMFGVKTPQKHDSWKPE